MSWGPHSVYATLIRGLGTDTKPRKPPLVSLCSLQCWNHLVTGTCCESEFVMSLGYFDQLSFSYFPSTLYPNG